MSTVAYIYATDEKRHVHAACKAPFERGDPGTANIVPTTVADSLENPLLFGKSCHWCGKPFTKLTRYIGLQVIITAFYLPCVGQTARVLTVNKRTRRLILSNKYTVAPTEVSFNWGK